MEQADTNDVLVDMGSTCNSYILTTKKCANMFVEYLNHPKLLFGLFWAFWLFVSFGISILCVPLSFVSRLSNYFYRATRVILWCTVPFILLFIVASIYDPANSKGEWWLGLIVTCLPSLVALIGFIKSHKSYRH